MTDKYDKTDDEKRIEFLEYFSEQFFTLLQKHSLSLEIKHHHNGCWLHCTILLDKQSYSATNSVEKIKNLLINQHAKIEISSKIFGSFVDAINQIMLVDAPKEIRQEACKNTDVWLKHTHTVLLDEFSLVEKVLSYAGKKNNQDAIDDILTLSSQSLVNLKKLATYHIDNIIHLTRKHLPEEKMITALNHFFMNHYLAQPDVELLIKDSIVKNFPNHIDEFYNLSCIEHYIMQYNDNDIMIPTNEISSLSLMLDCKKIYNYIDMPSFGLQSAQQLLQLMGEALEQTANSTHIEAIIIHHHQRKDEAGKKQYCHSYLIANITARYGATENTVNKEILNDWIKQMLLYCKNNPENLIQMISQHSSKTLKSFLFSTLLDKKLNGNYNDEYQSVTDNTPVKMKI